MSVWIHFTYGIVLVIAVCKNCDELINYTDRVSKSDLLKVFTINYWMSRMLLFLLLKEADRNLRTVKLPTNMINTVSKSELTRIHFKDWPEAVSIKGRKTIKCNEYI